MSKRSSSPSPGVGAGRTSSPQLTLVTLVDGDCALCSGYAQFVSAMDPRGKVYFETQQSEAGQTLLRRAGMPMDLSTIVTLECGGGNVRGYTKSTAVLRTFRFLGMPTVRQRGGEEGVAGVGTVFMVFLLAFTTVRSVNAF